MKKIDPIYVELAGRIEGADTEYIPRILEKLANLEQAKILLALPDRDRDKAAGRALTVSEKFAERLNLDKATIERHLKELFEKGVVFPTKVGPQMARVWMQLHDSALANPNYDDSLDPEYFDLWLMSHKKSREHLTEDLDLHPEAAPMRILPKWKAIKDISGVLPCEDMREVIKSQDLIVLIPCGCKRSYRNRECGVPEESCLTVGRTAQYNLDRGFGRKINHDEALEILEQLNEHPVINLVVNQRDVGQLICSCHMCCCGALQEGVASSRFIATDSSRDCTGCNACVERCQYGANEIKYDPDLGAERAYTDPKKCKGCGDCVISCPVGAKKMKLVRPAEHIPEALAIY